MFWVPNKVPVNRTECRCNCFDTVYKGNTFEYSDASASACASADLVGGGGGQESPDSVEKFGLLSIPQTPKKNFLIRA